MPENFLLSWRTAFVVPVLSSVLVMLSMNLVANASIGRSVQTQFKMATIVGRHVEHVEVTKS